MCGIVGWYGPPDEVRLQNMTSVIGHRGPDEAGIWSGERVSLGATRLSIIDLGAGPQPIWNEERTHAIIMNGEIYNAEPLRASLRGIHTFQTKTDTEVVLHLFEEHGVDCFRQLDGIYAIAITDGTRLWIARDGMGVKPLYYARTLTQDFVFGSELKALLRHPGVTRKINRLALAERKVFGWMNTSSSFLEGIQMVEPGVCLEVQATRDQELTLKAIRFYQLPEHDPHAVPDLEMICDLLTDTIHAQMTSDAPIGSLLSGGVDSSLMTLIMKGTGRAERFPVFTMADRPDLPDLINARELARVWGLEHQVISVTAEEVLADLPRAVWAAEHPGVSLMWFLAKKIPSHLKVLMCGEGADELFAGYGVYTRIAKQKQVLKTQLDELRASAPEWAQRVAVGVDELFSSEDDGNESFYRGYLRNQLLNNHLHDIDMGSMAHSMEVRVPYLGLPLVNKLVPLGLRKHLNGMETKSILRRVYQMVLQRAGFQPEQFQTIWGSKYKAPFAHGTQSSFGAAFQRLEQLISADQMLPTHPLAPFCRKPIDLLFFDLFQICYVDFAGRFPNPEEWEQVIRDSYPWLTGLISIWECGS